MFDKKKKLGLTVGLLSRPYVYAIHSEQPDTFGHRLGPLSSEVGVTVLVQLLKAMLIERFAATRHDHRL